MPKAVKRQSKILLMLDVPTLKIFSHPQLKEKEYLSSTRIKIQILIDQINYYTFNSVSLRLIIILYVAI